MNDDALWRWSAADIARGIRTRQISSVEATESCLDRISDVNSDVNALVEVTPVEALAMAEAADAAVRRGEALGPLHGVPLSIKVNTDQKGHATTHGVVAFKDAVAADDAPVTASLRASGAVFVGRSNTPAFSMRWITTNDLHGRTFNPWNASRSPGGSSGGAAAAVASGMVPLAQGNDVGGSIRYPAFACGVLGLRPTVGRVANWLPIEPDMPPTFQYFVAQGPIARTVGDLRLALQAMSLPDARDPLQVSVPISAEPLSRPLRIGLLRDIGVAAPSPAVNKALDDAAAWLAEAGYVVEEVSMPWLAEAFRIWYLLSIEDLRDARLALDQAVDEGARRSFEYLYRFGEELWGTRPTLANYIGGFGRRGTLIHRLQRAMETTPLLLTPVSAEPVIEQDADIQNWERARQLFISQWPMMTVPVLGFPAMSVPTGLSGGVPIGVQLIGRRFRDDTVLDAGEVVAARARLHTPIDPCR
jgi:amidase